MVPGTDPLTTLPIRKPKAGMPACLVIVPSFVSGNRGKVPSPISLDQATGDFRPGSGCPRHCSATRSNCLILLSRSRADRQRQATPHALVFARCLHGGQRYTRYMLGTQKKIVSLPWPEIDKIQLKAYWIEGTEPIRFAVDRMHDGIRRGRWEFQRAERNEWQCTRAELMYLREEPVFPRKPDPRQTDDSVIPEDICLKARDFLAAEMRLLTRLRSHKKKD